MFLCLPFGNVMCIYPLWYYWLSSDTRHIMKRSLLTSKRKKSGSALTSQKSGHIILLLFLTRVTCDVLLNYLS